MKRTNSQKLLCLFLALSMLLSLYAPAYATEWEPEDYESVEFYDDVEEASDEELVEPYDDVEETADEEFTEPYDELEEAPAEVPEEEYIELTEEPVNEGDPADEPVLEEPIDEYELVDETVGEIIEENPVEEVIIIDETEPSDTDQPVVVQDEIVEEEVLDDIIVELIPAEAAADASASGKNDKKEAAEKDKDDKKDKDSQEKEEKEKEDTTLFPGLPEEYIQSEGQTAAREAMIQHAVADTVASLTPDIDYVDGELWFLTEDEEYARMVADAYGAELTSFEYGVAVLHLNEGTVAEAVAAAENLELNMPPVSPNYIEELEPEPGFELEDNATFEASSYKTYARRSWEYWRDYYGGQFDPYLRDPSAFAGEGNASDMHYQYMHEMINTYDAWGVTKGSGVKVAVVDSGVASHDDLPSVTRLVVNKNIDKGDNPVSSHGTHVAGIIGARLGNGIGGAGIAPEVSMLSLQVLNDKGRGSNADIIRGVNMARERNVDIISMSIGGKYWNSDYEQAIRNAVDAGITVVCSSGNDSSNVMNYPGTFNIPGVICVGAVTQGRNRAGYSNFGPWVDIWAPGSNIWSTVTGNTYESFDGTSMATPVVSGACALYMSRFGHTDPIKMEKIIKASVTNGVLDVSKFFVKDTSAPVISVNGRDKNGKAPYGTTMSISMNPGDTILFSLNGKAPGLDKNGYPNADSILYDGPVKLNSILGITTGKKFTVKAVRITGMGEVSKASSLSLTVDYSAPTSVSYTEAPTLVMAGKTATPKVVVLPATANQTVIWSIYSQAATAPGVKIDAKTGKLTTKTTDYGKVVIRATTTGTPAKFKNLTITIDKLELAKKVILKSGGTAVAKLTLHANGATSKLTASALDKNGQAVTTKFSWTSSNANVAAVSTGGVITPRSKGTATITCKALDGSNVTAKCTVTVVQDVTDIVITGPDTVAEGKKITLKAAVYPSTANKKTLSWSVDEKSAMVGITIKNGVLSMPKKYTGARRQIQVTARSTDGSNISASYYVWTSPAATKVSLFLMKDPDFIGGGYTTNKDGTLKAITLFSVEQDYLNGSSKTWKDAEAKLLASIDEDAWTDIIWTSSNPNVVRVKSDGSYGHLYAVGAGTATVTAKANDAGGKKATVSVKVINPVSSVTVVSSAPTLNDDTFNGIDRFLGVGKSVANKAVLGDAYGKPSNGKVYWGYTVEVYDSNNNELNWIEEDIVNRKLIKLSSSGTVTAASGLKTYTKQNYRIIVTVIATSADNSELSGSCVYQVVPLTTKLYVYNNAGWDKNRGGYGLNILSDGRYDLFNVTSSNPKVGTAYFYGNKLLLYPNLDELPANGKAKFITIKVTACDGSGKSLSINVGFMKHANGQYGVDLSKVRYGA